MTLDSKTPMADRYRWFVMVFALLANPASSADEPLVAFREEPGRLRITIGGEPFATYVWQDEKIRRPYFSHVHAPGGVQVTRNHPPVAGTDATDHDTMHPGIWLAFGELGGHDFWRNRATVEHQQFAQSPRGGSGEGSFAVINAYRTADANRVVAREECRFTIRVRPDGWLLLWDSRFTPGGGGGEFAFGDQEEMGLGLRVATPMAVKNGGEIVNSEGRRNEREVWGRQADWCDYRGEVGGRRVGVALVPHPENFRRSWFHARDYGFVAANPFGQNAFTKGEKSRVVVKPGESLRLRFGVFVHGDLGDTTTERLRGVVREMTMNPHSAETGTPPSSITVRQEPCTTESEPDLSNARRPRSDAELKYWLENMVWHHRFTVDEIREATGLSAQEIEDAACCLGICAETKPGRPADAPLLVLPYPGGRHPRIGFLNGAVRPQRETKVSVFAPWDDRSYVVVDVPEAIWSNLGLTYLAHTHVATVWTKQNIDLEKTEWNRRNDGTFDIERRLPNGIAFGAKVVPGRDAVRMELWLTNGTKEPLSDLRVQNCVMLKGAAGFEAQTNDNKVLDKPFVAVKAKDCDRWIITAWDPCHRPWANPPCPCLHSDPKFPDCAPGETKRLRGWLSFYEGPDVRAEFARIDATGWRR